MINYNTGNYTITSDKEPMEAMWCETIDYGGGVRKLYKIHRTWYNENGLHMYFVPKMWRYWELEDGSRLMSSGHTYIGGKK